MSDFGGAALLACAAYVVVLLAIGAWSRAARREATLSDFYLAGRSLGPLVLLLTLFATQYSGNSLSGFPGQTYREGLAYYMSVTFMVGIVAGYVLFAPRLFALSRRRLYVTPTDFLHDRYRSPALSFASAAMMVLVLVNYLLAQLMALGHAFSGLTGNRVPYWAGVVGGALVILAYEWLGGMRAVAWTDALQGVLLACGLLFACGLVFVHVGSPGELVARIGSVNPGAVANPDLRGCAVWLSNLILLGLGAPLYPQAIQRIYAARGLTDLKRALAVMAFLPHLAITTVIFLGVAGLALFPGLSGAEADRITFRVLAHLVEQEPAALIPVLLVMMAVSAAIMSTADSCLLSLSSIWTRDIVGRLRGPATVRSERLTAAGGWFSLAVMAVLALVALRPLTTLWNLLVIKFEVLVQLSPAFVLGTAPGDERRPVEAPAILAGLTIGLAVALGLHFSGHRQVAGLHAGTLGVAANYLTALTVHVARGRRMRERAPTSC